VPALAEATVGSARQPDPVTLVLSRQVAAPGFLYPTPALTRQALGTAREPVSNAT
jgi:hypothetical protein